MSFITTQLVLLEVLVLELKSSLMQKITLSPRGTLCHLGFELLGLFAVHFIFHEYLTRTLRAPEDYRSCYLKTYAGASLSDT